MGARCVDCGTRLLWKGKLRCYLCSDRAWAWQRCAMRHVRNAIRSGKLPPATGKECHNCGKPAIGYDHRDYEFPLDVLPVCKSCNRTLPPPYIPKHPPPNFREDFEPKIPRIQEDFSRLIGKEISVSVEQLAATLEISRATLYNWLHAGRVPYKKLPYVLEKLNGKR